MTTLGWRKIDGRTVVGYRNRMSQKTNNEIKSAKDLDVYQAAYQLAMDIFELSKSFPAEEKFALTSQIRRSSRSVCLNLREAWAKRRYEAHFLSKLTDCDGENSETDSSLDFAKTCGYISSAQHQALTAACSKIGRMLGAMMKKSHSFLTSDLRPPTSDRRPPTSDR
jgi:four helix bundle protein